MLFFKPENPSTTANLSLINFFDIYCAMTHRLFLSSEDLQSLTGYKIGHYQARWLKAHGYPYELTISGKPRVLLSVIEKKLGLASTDDSTHTKPDFSHWQQQKET